MKPLVELVSTGSELLSGRTLNRHAQSLALALEPLHLRVDRDTTVPDDLDAIADAVRSALQRVDILVISGGLGPTSDDLTRNGVASAVGRKVVLDPGALEMVRARYAAYGRELPKSGERQAEIVEGAVVLANAVGAAPGERIDLEGKVIFILPGPPREFDAVLTDHVLPWLAANGPVGEEKPQRLFMLGGIGESDIIAKFDEAGFPPKGVDVGYCAAPGRVELRLETAPGEEGQLEAAAATVVALLSEHIFSRERETLEEAIGKTLAGRGSTLAVAESCTGGMIGARITRVSGSSGYFLGGILAYSNESKTRDLDVSPNTLAKEGAVSAAVAEAMARGVRERFGSDYGLSVTGIAGPTGGTDEKPVGLAFIGLADANGAIHKRVHFPGDRAWIRERCCLTALDLLRRRIPGSQ